MSLEGTIESSPAIIAGTSQGQSRSRVPEGRLRACGWVRTVPPGLQGSSEILGYPALPDGLAAQNPRPGLCALWRRPRRTVLTGHFDLVPRLTPVPESRQIPGGSEDDGKADFAIADRDGAFPPLTLPLCKRSMRSQDRIVEIRCGRKSWFGPAESEQRVSLSSLGILIQSVFRLFDYHESGIAEYRPGQADAEPLAAR